jgi:hypothetical protein
MPDPSLNRVQIIVEILVVVILTLVTMGLSTGIQAQSLEPRAYSNAPIGLNFLLGGFQNSQGGLALDPTIPIDDVNADVDLGFFGYVRTLDVAGNSARIGVKLPYASVHVDGFVDGVYRVREIDGPGDPTVFFSYNFYGAPALTAQQFRQYRPDRIAGFTLSLTAPLGDYDSSRMINISTNRWTIKPEIGMTRVVDNWTLETSAAVSLFTDNNDFNNGQTRTQDPIYSVQFHVTYTFTNKVWLAASATYYEGGETSIDSVDMGDLQRNWRSGVTLAVPVNRNHSIKLYGSSGVSTRTGTDFDTVGAAWQYRWGGGI